MAERLRLSFTDIELSKYNGEIIRESGTGTATLTHTLPVRDNMFYIIRQVIGFATSATTGAFTITVNTSTTTFSNIMTGAVDWKFENPIILHGSDANVISFAPSTAGTTGMFNVFYSRCNHKENI